MTTAAKNYDVADLALADDGQLRIEWADRHMPVLASIRARFEREKPLEGIQLGLCLHVTTETANLVRTLVAGGADVALCASNPLSTQDDVAAALVDRHNIEVYAIKGEGDEAYYAHINAVCDKHPKITMDDGADVIVCEVDPLPALEAVMDGYEVMPSIDAAREGDIFITVTGDMHALGGQHFGVMKSGAIVANSGHFNVEIDIPALMEMAVAHREARPFVEEYELGDGRRIFLLAEGRLINLAAAEGHL